MNNYTVDKERWSKMSIFEQMGNIYSEVGRAFKAHSQGDGEKTNQAVYRALDLFDATVSALLLSSPARLKEVLRAKEQFLLAVYADSYNENDIASLDKYFRDFAVAARLART